MNTESLNHLYVGTKVYSQARADDDLPAWGVIWGFPDGVAGAICMFHQSQFQVYFLAMYEDMEWQGDGWYIDQSKAKLIRLKPAQNYILVNSSMEVYEYVRCLNRSRVPLRTNYRYV